MGDGAELWAIIGMIDWMGPTTLYGGTYNCEEECVMKRRDNCTDRTLPFSMNEGRPFLIALHLGGGECEGKKRSAKWAWS